MRKARLMLQMPPYLPPRQLTSELMSSDERLNPLNLKKTNYLFIDISRDIPDEVQYSNSYITAIASILIICVCLQKRSIVVREHNGNLRQANQLEREKMLQVYYPRKGQTIHVPAMFGQMQLEV